MRSVSLGPFLILKMRTGISPFFSTVVASILACSLPLHAQQVPPKAIESFLSEHCYDCHDDAVAKGGLNLLELDFSPEKHANFEAWRHVFERARAGEMPPEKKPRPDAEKLANFLTELKSPLMAADRNEKRRKGAVHVRRLTRREYEFAVHDLLGIDIPLQEHLPEDPSTHGFETVAEGQQLSHFNLASYLETADLAIGEAFKRVVSGDEKYEVKLTPKDLTKKGAGNYRGPEAKDGKSIAWTINQQFYGRMPATTVPESGWYRVTLKKVEAINPIDGKQPIWGTLRSGACSSDAPLLTMIGTIEATKTKRDLVYEAWIEKGHKLELKPNEAGLKRAPSGAGGGNVSYTGQNLMAEGYQGIAVAGIEIKRIYPNAVRGTVRGRLYSWMKPEQLAGLKNKETREPLIRKLIGSFAWRAFRRPVRANMLSLTSKLRSEC